MKTITLICFFATIFLLHSNNYAQAQTPSSNDSITAMLKNFYTDYMAAFSADPTPVNKAKAKAIKKKYCTERVLSKIKKQQDKGELDYDPFLNAQDSDTANLKTLLVKKDPKKANVYIVSYNDDYSKYTINVMVIKEKESYKIDAVW